MTHPHRTLAIALVFAVVPPIWLCGCLVGSEREPLIPLAGAAGHDTPRAAGGRSTGLEELPSTPQPAEPSARDRQSDSQVPEATEPGSARPPGDLPASPLDGDDGGTCRTFASSFEALQHIVFEGHSCSADACHGEAALGGLDLRPEVAWDNLVDAPSTNSGEVRVSPGSAIRSFLYQKLVAATKPDEISVQGSPMPVGRPPLSERELEALRLWIVKGAPREGVVRDATSNLDVGTLLGACLPPAGPTKAAPLAPPASGAGIQLRLPVYTLKAASEVEACIPFAVDFREQVPPAHQDPVRNVVYVNGSHVRQDPQSHHLVVWNPRKPLPTAAPPGQTWTCQSGDSLGKPCDPSRGSRDCGNGVCAGEMVEGTFCDASLDTTAVTQAADPLTALLGALTFGLGLATVGMPEQIANTQSPQQILPPLDGIYSEVPLTGILWFNTHAFNLTEQDTDLEGRLNYLFPERRERLMQPFNIIDNLNIATGLAPFTRATFCAKHVVPLGYSLAMMTGHTHRRGEHFWVTDPSGSRIYENFSYNDPEYTRFDPFRTFDGLDDASRTLEYCATFSNGLKKDGSPDMELVTRASRMPKGTRCTPVACVAGRTTEACTTNADCDTERGAGDGVCDACAITAGTTTENEMFVLMPWYVLPRL